MFINRSVLIRNQSSNISLQIVRNFIPKNFLSGLLSEEEEKREDTSRDLKKWRNPPVYDDGKSFIGGLKRSTPNKVFPIFFGRGSLSPAEDSQMYIENLRKQMLDYDQRFIPERHQTLGNDLAVAHIIIGREGRVRSVGSEKFLSIMDVDEIPTTYQASWFLEEIDCSNMAISYNGLINLKGLRHLKRVTYKNCNHFDNWCLDRIVALCPHIEYLDISDCKDIDENGLECLYKSWNLKELIVTDWYGSPKFELACLLLEDCKPDLVVKRLVKSPDERPKDLGDPYVPSRIEKYIAKFEKFIKSKQTANQQ